jgi:phospholipid/cholesterol/gamma-HCH transport system substrate-binding protein
MITRSIIVKGIAFVVLTVGLILYVGANFLGVFNFIGDPDYTVKMPLKDASGLFPRGEVTYRGVKVGEVGPLDLNDTGLTANIILDGGGPEIPADLQAVVSSRSAVGERFLDLKPNSNNGPYLKDGGTIPADRVQVPVQVEAVLANLDKLAATVPLPDLQTTVSELSTAFNNLGPKLQILLDSTNALVNSANEYLPQTLTLIRDARTVLQTQNELANPIRSFSSDLKEVTAQLRESDEDIRRLTDTGSDAGNELSALLDESGDPLRRTLREALTLSQITRNHVRDIQSVLQLYPGLAAAIPTILPDTKDPSSEGRARLALVLNLNDPPLCPANLGNGYFPPPQGSPYTTEPVKPHPKYRAYCRAAIGGTVNVRGVKPEYPFKDNKPQPPPEWYEAFYRDGPYEGIFGSPTEREGVDQERDRQQQTRALKMHTSLKLPGLLSAPATTGSFGLTPAVLGK